MQNKSRVMSLEGERGLRRQAQSRTSTPLLNHSMYRLFNPLFKKFRHACYLNFFSECRYTHRSDSLSSLDRRSLRNPTKPNKLTTRLFDENNKFTIPSIRQPTRLTILTRFTTRSLKHLTISIDIEQHSGSSLNLQIINV